MKKLILIIFLFFVYGCGYSSVYKDLQNQELKIVITQMQGDRDMNNLIQNEINLYSNESSTAQFDVDVKTDFRKKIIAKNSAGSTTDYELSATSLFTILFKGKTQQVTFIETINVKNKKDSFEQNLYEKNIKRNFASSIRERLIFKILNIK